MQIINVSFPNDGLGDYLRTAFVKTNANFQEVITLLVDKANLTSPVFNGVPQAPTAPLGTSTTQIATTAFVIANSSGGSSLKYYAEPAPNPTTLPIVTGANSIAIGDGAEAKSNEMFVVGTDAGKGTANVNISNFIGLSAGQNAKNSSWSNFFGSKAGKGVTGSSYSNFFGLEAGENAMDASYSNFLGPSAGQNSKDSFESNFFGLRAGNNSTNSYYSNFFGSSAGQDTTDTLCSNFFGIQAGINASYSSRSNFFGINAGNAATNANDSNFFGSEAGKYASGSYYSNFIGINAGRDAINANNSNFFGNQTGQNAISASFSNFFGDNAGRYATNANNSNFFGTLAGSGATSSSYSNLFGFSVGRNFTGNNIGSNNIIIGTNISLPNATANSINLGGVLFGTGAYATTTGNPSIVAQTNGRIGINKIPTTHALEVAGAISATTYVNLPQDIYVTGGTYSNGTATFRNNSGSTFNVSGFLTGVTIPVTSVFGRTGIVTAQSGDYTTAIVADSIDKRYQTDAQRTNNNATSPIQGQLDGKQATLVSGTNIKTINGNSLLGSGDVVIGGSSLKYYAEPAQNPTTLPIVTGANSIAIGDGAEAKSNNMFVVGQSAGFNTSGVTNSNLLGQNAGFGATGASFSNFFGLSSGYGATGSSRSNFFGNSTGNGATNASFSNFFGPDAGTQAINSSNSNFFGNQAGLQATGVTYSNLFGFSVGRRFTGNNIGSNNIIIGTNITLPNATANSINLGGVLFGTGTYATTTGNPSIVPQTNGRIGINKIPTTHALEVAGAISATTYVNLPQDIYVTGGTYSNGTATFRNNSGSTFSISGFSTATTITVDQTLMDGSTNAISNNAVYDAFSLAANQLELKSENSASALSGFEITNNGDGTIDVNGGVALLRDQNDPYAILQKYTIAGVTNLAMIDNANNFVLVDYNSGSPGIIVTQNPDIINGRTNSIIAGVSRVGTTLDYISLVGQGVDSWQKIRSRFLDTETVTRAKGLELGASGLTITSTAGIAYAGMNKLNVLALNTHTQAYRNGSAWIRTTGQTNLNNTQYNNAGTLTTLTNGRFRVDYVYVLVDNPSKLYTIMGEVQYNTIADARLAAAPAVLPTELQFLGMRIGRVIVERNATTVEVSSEFNTVYRAGSVQNHNDLALLNTGDYNHFRATTSADAGKVLSVNSQGIVDFQTPQAATFITGEQVSHLEVASATIEQVIVLNSQPLVTNKHTYTLTNAVTFPTSITVETTAGSPSGYDGVFFIQASNNTFVNGVSASLSNSYKLYMPNATTLVFEWVPGQEIYDGYWGSRLKFRVVENGIPKALTSKAYVEAGLAQKATLDANGKIISSQIPAIAITDTFVVANQAAMLALSAETGDVAVRTDLNKTYILKDVNPSILANWQELLTPTDAVASIFGRTGVVTAQVGDYTTAIVADSIDKRYQTDTQRTNNNATSPIQGQLDGKQATLVSGTNIKTVGGQSIVGSGNITEVQNSMVASTVLAPSVTAVNTELASKQATLVSGTNIKTVNGNSLLGSGDIVIGGGSSVAQIVITTSTSITTDTLGDAPYATENQNGKNVIISNGSNVINITVNGNIPNFMASYLKHGTGQITFVAGSGRTLIQVDNTNIMSGLVGSTATISSIGTTDYLKINNR